MKTNLAILVHLALRFGFRTAPGALKAMACIDFARGAIGPVVPMVDEVKPVLRERLFDCEHFGLWRFGAESPFGVGAERTLRVLVCLAGDGQVAHDGAAYAIGKEDAALARRGRSVFMPTLNPAVARGPDGKLYLFPWLVAKGNYSRIGIARVKFNEAGDAGAPAIRRSRRRAGAKIQRDAGVKTHSRRLTQALACHVAIPRSVHSPRGFVVQPAAFRSGIMNDRASKEFGNGRLGA